MTAFKFDRFSGLIPRAPESLLPAINATVSVNCEFSYGELRNTKGDYMTQEMRNSPATMYTDNGLTFYSWPDDVNAVRSPLAKDAFDRLYYTTPTDFRVTSRAGMSITGGVPGSSYRVGVPKPSVAPTMTVPDGPSLAAANITAVFHYEYAGVKYQVEFMPQITRTDAEIREWTFTPPTKAASQNTPEQAFPVIHLLATDLDTKADIFDIYTINSSLSTTKSGWALNLTKNADGTSYTLTLTSSPNESDKETRAYVYTYVNTYGEEGPPSPPGTITAWPMLIFAVHVTRDAITADYAPIKEIRFYRTPTGSEIADYFYVGALPVLTSAGTEFTFSDGITAAELNEPLSSDENYPPSQDLLGLMALPNGILCAWKGNELHFSDAYKPWSWPPQYVKTFTHNIVGGLVHGSGALITTLAQPFFISGVSPDSMTEGKVNSPQAGVSKWAIADVGGFIAYASNDGIVVINGNQATLDYSEQFFTRDVWRARYKSGFSSMRFAVWDGRLIVFSASDKFTPFMIRLDESKGAMTDIPSLLAACSFVSPLSDQFYYAKGSKIYQFAGGSDLAAAWSSREMIFPAPLNFGIAQAVCEGSWSVSFFADGTLKHTQALTGSATFRLLSGFKSDRWKVAVAGAGRFRELRVAETAKELRAI